MSTRLSLDYLLILLDLTSKLYLIYYL